MLFHTQEIQEVWKKEDLVSFDELMLTWNAERPKEGDYLFYISVKTDEWSPFLLYAVWGKESQSSFLSEKEGSSCRSYQDAVEVLEGKKATGFQVKLVAENGSSLQDIHALHVSTNGDQKELIEDFSPSKSLQLNVKGLSQMALPHPKAQSLCSPTSSTAVLRYLLQSDTIDPISFAEKSWDSGFDIFGNWVLNLAQAAAILGPSWNCWVQRLNGFADIYEQLAQGTPVVVSVKGPLIHSAQPYAKGHLLVVTGYDSAAKTVLCMDPAFPSDKETNVSYPLTDFVEAWNRRGRIAYIYSCAKNSKSSR